MSRRVRRWGPRYTRRDLTVANAFTGARLLLIPVFGWLWWVGDDERALWVFVVAAATDVVDGFLARWLNQESRLGALLDPIADKLLMFVSLLAGIHRGVIPVWLAVCVIGRDFVLAVGAVLFSTVWQKRHSPEAWRPTRIGKYAMFLQSVSVAGVIFDATLQSPPPWLRAYLEVGMALAAVMTIVAGAQYTLRAARAIRSYSTPHEHGKPGSVGP
jgi:cardiolipin synthase (CMP-forming)